MQVKFSEDILKKFDYTGEKHGYLAAGDCKDPSLLQGIPIITADLMTVTKELAMFVNGYHPNPSRVGELLPEKVR